MCHIVIDMTSEGSFINIDAQRLIKHIHCLTYAWLNLNL
jgi:hypothetical protein